MAKKIKKRLFDLEALEVSLVPAGVNGRKMLVTKEEQQMDEILKELLESDLKDEAAMDEKILAMLPEEVKKEAGEVAKIQGTMKATVKLLQGLAKRLPEKDRQKIMGNLGQLTGLSKIGKEDEKTPEQIAKEAAEAEAAKKAAEDDKEPVKKEGQMDPEIEKKIEAILKSNEKLESENKGLKEEIAKERNLRVAKEFEDRASKEFSHVGDAKTVGAVLKEAKENMSEEAFKQFETVLKSSQTKIEAGNIFGELGSNQGISSDLESKVKVAKEAVMKEDPKLSAEAAEAKVFEQNPDLYKQYLDENPAQGGH